METTLETKLISKADWEQLIEHKIYMESIMHFLDVETPREAMQKVKGE